MDQQTKEKLATQPNIYVDCKMLLGRLYDIRWKVPRRDRSYLFNDLLIPISLSLITHFRKAYKFREERLKEIDLFLFEFYRFEELIDLASSKKIINEKQTASILEYLVRIRSNMDKWRKSSRKTRSNAASNDGDVPENKESSRGGDGFI